MTSSTVTLSRDRRTASAVDSGAIWRWMRTLVAKNSLGGLVLRTALLPMLVSIGGALFTAAGPMPTVPDVTGAPPVEATVFIAIGYLIFGQLIVLVTSAWLYTREVTSRELGADHLAQPRRGVIVVGSALVAAATATITSIVCLLAAYVTFAWVAGGDVVATLTAPAVTQMLLALPPATGLLAVIAVCLAVVLRNPIATVVIVVLWATYAEDTLGGLPVIGFLREFAPLTNAYASAGVSDAGGIAANPVACLLWVALLAMMALAIAVFVAHRRPGWIR